MDTGALDNGRLDNGVVEDSRRGSLLRGARRASVKRATVTLVCMVCGGRNYKTTKTRRDGTAPLTLKKHCKDCNLHTEHRESR